MTTLLARDMNIFIEKYPIMGKKWCIENLGMTDASVRHYAQKYSLKSRCKFSADSNFKRGSAFRGKKRLAHSLWLIENHPMKGKHLSKKTKDKISLSISELQKGKNNTYSHSKSGHYDINGKDIFFRSSWEANYALYLDFLIKIGEIEKWEFEKDTFWFENIRRGVRSYLPDFKVFMKDGSIQYHEVKGWLDPRSKTKIKRMAKYYPEIKLILIDKPIYRDIEKKIGKVLKFF